MNKTQIKKLNKQVDKIISRKKTLTIWPLLGGLSTYVPGEDIPDRPSRPVTPQESEMLKSKGLPIPITIELGREEEFQEYLKT